MNDTVPSDEDITKLEKAVKSARFKVRHLQGLLRDADVLQHVGPTQIKLTLFPVPNLPDEEEEGTEETRLMAVLICKGELGQAIEELEIAKERRRVDEVVKAREEEINFGKDVDDCPICIEPLHAGEYARRTVWSMPCCGKQTCPHCFQKCSEQNFSECPLCRHPFPVSQAYAEEMREKFAETKPYFQYLVGKQYFDGSREGGVSNFNDRKSLKYIKKAAEGGDSEAQALLGFLYVRSPRGIVEKSLKDAFNWRELAASNGHIFAHIWSSQTCIVMVMAVRRTLKNITDC